jgi:hypothetical protein
MKKTEESLRRLKKGKMSAFSLFGSPTGSREQESKDDECVRVQMVLDVAALGKDARSLGVDLDNHVAFRELEAMAARGNGEGTMVCNSLMTGMLTLAQVHECLGRGWRFF